MGEPPIGPYPDPKPPAALRPWNPNAPAAAARVISLIADRLPGAVIEHIGSSAVPGCAGKGYLDLLIPSADESHLAAINAALFALGFARQHGREPFPETRPMRHGTIEHEGETFIIHVHVVPAASPEVEELRDFRARLRGDRALMERYVAAKQAILHAGVEDSFDYTKAKASFIAALGYRGADDA
jgi:GrpB-like predicted nucleotidyltransferase (UPF0157 family)